MRRSRVRGRGGRGGGEGEIREIRGIREIGRNSWGAMAATIVIPRD